MPTPQCRLATPVAARTIRSCSAALLAATLLGGPSPSVAAALPSVSSVEAQGHADRLAFEAWTNGLNAEQHRGVDFWARERSKPKPAPCITDNPSPNWVSGCQEAQRRLAAVDVRRKTEPDYRKGWNAPVADASAAPPPSKAEGAVQAQHPLPLSPAATGTPAPPHVQDLVRATQATFDAAADCLAHCQATLVRDGQATPDLLLPVRFADLLKTGAWRARFLEMLSSLPPAFMNYGVIQPGEFTGLTMAGDLAAIITQDGRTLYVYSSVGLPEGFPPRHPAGSIYVIADPKDAKLAGIWNGAADLDQYRFLGTADKLPPLLAFRVAGEAEMEKMDMVDRVAQPAPVVLPLPPDRVAYTKERLDYLAALLDDGEIHEARSVFHKGDLLRAAADANRTHWFATELNGKRCIDGVSPAQQIENIRTTGWQARTKDTNDASGKLVKVEIEHDEGLTIVTRTVYTSLAACEADVAKRNAIPDRYR